ncbi:MAG TPA: phage Gp37/Gp68 family protein [Phycisphaerae bacterium]|nr:phage Gp37/Gp68 family protein [Phycisphaerae bacterium]
MAQGSRIEWTGSTWNPIVGCTKVSAGCKNCYAERMAKRLAAMARADRAAGRDPGRKGNYLHVIDRRGQWNGNVFLDYPALEDPLRWRSPRVVFVNSMSDLFHEDLPLHFIRAVFAVMNRCPQHTFQVLTKRPHLAAEYSGELCWTENIWMGTTVENATVTHRVQTLRRTGAHIKFLSLEPLLGAIPRLPLSGIDWVIVGGESGPGARPMKPEWVRRIRDRCLTQGLPFFFKQWGGVNKKCAGRLLDGRAWTQMPNGVYAEQSGARRAANDMAC